MEALSASNSKFPKPWIQILQKQIQHTKRQCRADRASSIPIEALDMSKLSLFGEDRSLSVHKRRLTAGKRRRCGSLSVSGRSSATD